MTKNKILQLLKKVIDPELGINIVDLGLIYNIDINQKEKTLKVLMTLTTPFCPFNGYLLEQVKEILESLNFNKVDLELTFDPLWTPKLISPKLKKEMKNKKTLNYESPNKANKAIKKPNKNKRKK